MLSKENPALSEILSWSLEVLMVHSPYKMYVGVGSALVECMSCNDKDTKQLTLSLTKWCPCVGLLLSMTPLVRKNTGGNNEGHLTHETESPWPLITLQALSLVEKVEPVQVRFLHTTLEGPTEWVPVSAWPIWHSSAEYLV